MSTTPIITGDRSAAPDLSGSRRTRWIVGIAILAIAMVTGLWFIGTRGGGPDAFAVLDDEAVAEANALVEILLGYEATWDAGDLEAFADYLADDDFEFVEPASHIRSKQGFIDFMRPSFYAGVAARSTAAFTSAAARSSSRTGVGLRADDRGDPCRGSRSVHARGRLDHVDPLDV
jgi:hypothetical protein